MLHSKALGSFPQIDLGSPPCRPRCVNKEVQVGKKRVGVYQEELKKDMPPIIMQDGKIYLIKIL